jgi:hypothetical protein
MTRSILALIGLALPCGAFAQQNPPNQNEPPDINFQFKVDQAIDKGIKWLKGKRTGSYHKEIQNGNELILLTYIHAGVPENDPDFQALMKEALENKLERTYKVALTAMCFEEIDRVKYQWRIHQCAQFLVDNIDDAGESRYGQPTIFVEDVPTTSPARKDVATTTEKPKDARIKDAPYDPTKKTKPPVKNLIHVKRKRAGPAEHDHSNMQYHALGLRACYDAGIRFEESYLKLVDTHWRKTQIDDPGAKKEPIQLDGAPIAGAKAGSKGATSVMPTTVQMEVVPAGWGYQSGATKSHGSMTVGAVGALCISDYMMGKDWRKDQDVVEGMQWIAKHFTVTENPEYGAKWHYYYLYGLERAGMLFGTEIIGPHKWYRTGAEYLLAQQGADGKWNDVVDTCFAILFLRRATRRLDVATSAAKR